jgi:colanic acid/amylovoran biosynthesis glycosyltransferase
VPSTVWMYRQLMGLGDEVKQVYVWKHHSPELFPVADSLLTTVPSRFAQPLKGWKRGLDSMIYPRYGGPRYGLAFSRWMLGQLRRKSINAVLCQFGPCAMEFERLCRGAGISVFAHFHGHDITAALKNKRYRTALEKQWQTFAGIAVVAQYQKDWFVSHGYAPESIALIPCGAPAREIAQNVSRAKAALSPHEESSDECRFLFVGRFVDKKDPISLLMAFERCWTQQPQSRLTMAGFGKLEEACKQWVASKSDALRAAIEFPGQLSPEQVIDQMARANVYVQHSRTSASGDKEGWPVTIAEAMAAGLPIVATRHAGIIDQVIEGETGFLCDEGDWSGMADGMITLAADASKRLVFAKRSQVRGLLFDQEYQVKKLRDFIFERTFAVQSAPLRRAA